MSQWSFQQYPKKDFRKVPGAPGVYKYLNKDGKIIYVGKAKNLKKRLTIEDSTSRLFDLEFFPDGEKIAGVPEADVDRTTAAGKASAVQFIHFPFTDAQVEKFRTSGSEVVIGFDHPQYSHMAVMPEAVRAALAQDFD